MDCVVSVISRTIEIAGTARLQFLVVERKVKQNGNVVWGLPGGKIEPGEAMKDAARRETQEETGLWIWPEDEPIFMRVDEHGNRTYAFACTSATVDFEEYVGPEGLRVKFMSVDELTDPALTPFPAYNRAVTDAWYHRSK